MTNKQRNDPLTIIKDTIAYLDYIVDNVMWNEMAESDVEKCCSKIDSGLSMLVRNAITNKAWKPSQKQPIEQQINE